MTILSKDCGYYNEEINDEYSPYPGECEDYYRYGICMAVKELDEMTDIEAADILIDIISNIVSHKILLIFLDLLMEQYEKVRIKDDFIFSTWEYLLRMLWL